MSPRKYAKATWTNYLEAENRGEKSEKFSAHTGAGHTTGFSGEASDQADTVAREDGRRRKGGGKIICGTKRSCPGGGKPNKHRRRDLGQKLVLIFRSRSRGRGGSRSGRIILRTAGHLAAAVAASLRGRGTNVRRERRELSQHQRHGEDHGHNGFHKTTVVTFSKTMKGAFWRSRSLCLRRGRIRRADFRDVFVRRLVEIFLAALAA